MRTFPENEVLNMKRRTLINTAMAGAAAIVLSACGMQASMDNDGGDIVDVASGAGSFSTLVAAVDAAGLVDTLKGPGPFTVFAPTDEAFAALPAGTVDNLLLPENRDQLVSILTYHVVPGRIAAADLPGNTRVNVATVQGGNLVVDTRDGVTVNGADVITADVAATNGVIHVIDQVLLP